MSPPSPILSALLLSLAACAHGAHSVGPLVGPLVSPPARPLDLTPAAVHAPGAPLLAGDLRSSTLPLDALETRCPSPHCASTGTTSEVTLDTRAEEAYALFVGYARSLSNRSSAELRALLADTVTSIDPANPQRWSREHAVSLHERLFDRLDARGFEATSVRVTSFEDCQRQRCEATLRPGDWLVEWRSASFRQSPIPGAPVPPTQMIVRWDSGAPRAVRLSGDFLAPRNPGRP